MNQTKLKIFGFCFATMIILAGMIAGFFFLKMDAFLHTSASSKNLPVPESSLYLIPDNIIFTIHPGQSLNRIAANLEKQGLISSHLLFKLYVQYKKSDTRLMAGEYQLSALKTPVEILDTLIKGKVRLYRLTIPEGLNMDEIAILVSEAGFCPAPDFLSLCLNFNFIQKLKLNSFSLEGYLYPDTYFFPKHTPCDQIIQKMVDTFHNVYTREWHERTKMLGFTVHEIVTLASIIEKETGDAPERPLISSVFHNRLKKKMRLESDPTVIYGDKEFDGRIRRRHLQRKTPYNTYQIRGLPPGPIANPGALALQSALYPADANYLFFVSKNDTTHKFSKTFAEHNRAVKKYQLNQ